MIGPALRVGGVVAGALLIAACSGSTEPDPATTTTTSQQTTTTTSAPAATITTTTTTTTAPADDGIAVDGVTVTADTIYIGLLADLSGPYSGVAIDIIDAQLVFWSEVNESGGIADRNVELLIEDTSSDPERHSGAYQDLKDRVVIFSHSGSPTPAAFADDLRSGGRLAIAGSRYSGWADPELGSNVIEIGGNYCIEAINALNAIRDIHLAETGAAPTLAIATDSGSYGQDSAAGARFLADFLGLQILYDGEGAIVLGQDKGAIAAGIAQSGADWTWLATDPNSAAEIVVGARTEGYTGRWSGAMPSYSTRLLAGELGDYVAQAMIFSASFAPLGAEVEAMPEVFAALSEAFPDRYPSNGLVQGYLEFAATKQILDRAAERGDLTPEGLRTAQGDLGGLEFGGITPPTVFAATLDEAMTRATALYQPDKAAFEAQGGLNAALAENAVSPQTLLADFFVSEVAAAQVFDGPCYTVAPPEDDG